MSTHDSKQPTVAEQQKQPAETIKFSFCGENKFSTELDIVENTFADLSKALSTPEIGEKDGPYIVRGPATKRNDKALEYGDLAILDGDLSIDLTTGLTIPADSVNYTGCPNPTAIHAELVKLDITHCIVTTYSHTHQVNKCRVFFPYKSESEADLTNAINYLLSKLHSANILLADVKENHNWSQPWFLPRIASENSPFNHYYYGGELIDKTDVDAWATENKNLTTAKSVKTEDTKQTSSVTPYQPNDLDKACSKITAVQFTQLLEKHAYINKSTGIMNDQVSHQFMASGSSSGSAGVNLFYSTDSDTWVVKTHHGEHDHLNKMPNSFGNYGDALSALEYDGRLEFDEKISLVNELLGNQVPINVIQQAKIDVVSDVTAPFEPEVISALADLKSTRMSDYIRDIHALKTANDALSLPNLRKQIDAISKPKKPSTQDLVISLVKTTAILFADDSGKGYAQIQVDGHVEHHLIDSTQFKDFISKNFYDTTGTVLKRPDLSDAIFTLNGMAIYSNDIRPVFLRCAKLEDDYFIDLCNPAWQVVKVSKFDWEVLDISPVAFIRNKNMHPLPYPTKSKVDLSRIIANTNLFGDNLTLILAFIVEAFRIDTPHAIADLCGCQGSAKSYTQTLIRMLIDPNKVNLRGAPSSVEDVYIGAKNSYILSLNNLSRLSAVIQDALCNLATGGGDGRRKLYSDDEESVFDVKSPVIFNSIVDVATAADLIDRSIKILLPSIEAKNRKTEQALKAQLDIDISFIFAGILNLFFETLAEIPNINLSNPPRMADFAILGAAMVKTPTYLSLGLNTDFEAIYANNRTQSTQNALESSPVALALQDYLNLKGKFKGTVKELLYELTLIKQNNDAWPKSPKGLSDVLKRLEVPLAGIGITINRQGHSVKGSQLSITLNPNFSQQNNFAPKSMSLPSPSTFSSRDIGDNHSGDVFSKNNNIFSAQPQHAGSELNIMKLVPDEFKSNLPQPNPFDKK